MLIRFLIWPEKYTSVFNDLKPPLSHQGIKRIKSLRNMNVKVCACVYTYVLCLFHWEHIHQEL